MLWEIFLFADISTFGDLGFLVLRTKLILSLKLSFKLRARS